MKNRGFISARVVALVRKLNIQDEEYLRSGATLLKTVTKIGIVFVAVGGMLLIGLSLLVLLFAVGGSHNPPLSSPLREFVTVFFTLGLYWFIFVALGAALVIFGALQRKPRKGSVQYTRHEPYCFLSLK